MGVYLFRYENSGNRIMQIYDYATAKDQRFGWSGDQMISEVSTPSWTIARRHVFGPVMMRHPSGLRAMAPPTSAG
jgi:hypothetical protein